MNFAYKINWKYRQTITKRSANLPRLQKSKKKKKKKKNDNFKSVKKILHEDLFQKIRQNINQLKKNEL